MPNCISMSSCLPVFLSLLLAPHSLPSLSFSFFPQKPSAHSQCYSLVCGRGTIHWNTVNLPRTTPLREIDCPRTHQCPIAPQLAVRLIYSPSCWNVIWLDLIQVLFNQLQQLGVREHSSLVTSRRHQIATVLPDSGIYSLSTHSSAVFPECWQVSMWSRCPIYGRAAPDMYTLPLDQAWVTVLTTSHYTKLDDLL